MQEGFSGIRSAGPFTWWGEIIGREALEDLWLLRGSRCKVKVKMSRRRRGIRESSADKRRGVRA
jgi:hypothetical protein